MPIKYVAGWPTDVGGATFAKTPFPLQALPGTSETKLKQALASELAAEVHSLVGLSGTVFMRMAEDKIFVYKNRHNLYSATLLIVPTIRSTRLWEDVVFDTAEGAIDHLLAQVTIYTAEPWPKPKEN